MARAAHTCSLYYTGTTTAVLGEACQVVAGTGGLVYEITDPYTGDAFTVAGAEMTSRGHELSLPKNSSRVLMYRRAKE